MALLRRLLFVSLCLYGYSLVNSHKDLQLALERSYGGKFEFLTMLGSLLTMFTLIVVTFESILKTNILLRTKTILLAISFPIETVVTVFYWCLYFYDPLLLHQGPKPIGLDTDICLHLVPGVALWIEFLEMKNFKSSKYHIWFLLFLCVSYFAWVHFLFTRNEKWVYPILGIISFNDRVLFFSVSTFFAILTYFLGIFIHSKKHRK